MQNKYHECRFAASVILVNQFEDGSVSEKETIYNFYLNHTEHVNNWDLVDLSSYKIVGAWLINKDRAKLYELAKNNLLWNQRIAMVSTWAFIRNDEFEDTLRIAQQLITHPHHLINKACGWMLREVGKRNKATLTQFLDKFAPKMPRVMLRYSIEKLSEKERKTYLRAQIK